MSANNLLPIKTIQCVKSIWSRFCLKSDTGDGKNYRICFVMHVKQNGSHVNDWWTLVTGTRASYISSLMWFYKDRWSKCFWFVPRICVSCIFVWYLLPNMIKSKCIPNTFLWSMCNACYAFIIACVSTVCNYLFMCIQLKLVLGLINC